MNSIIHPKQKEYGQSMVELALTITILMVLLAGTMDLGRAFFTWLAMRDAAQEGASYGSIAPPGGNLSCNKDTTPIPPICARVWDNLEQVVREPEKNITVKVTGDPNCFGDLIRVDVEYNFPIATPLLGSIIGDPIPIHASIKDTVLAMCR